MLTLGDQWILLILQQAFLNRARRFSQWRDVLGISDSVLANRLKELTAADILAPASYRDGHRQRDEYLLTQRGLDLWPLLVCMWTWEEQWVTLSDSELWLEHLPCHASTVPLLMCGHCNAFPVSARDTETIDLAGGPLTGGPRLRHHRRASRSLDTNQVLAYDAQTLAILGDRWSTLILGAAFLGATTFAMFRDKLAVAPSILSERLKVFLDQGILTVVPGSDRRVRHYRLTPKGFAFFPVLAFMWDWADQHLSTDDGPHDLRIVHRACGERLKPRLACSACHQPIGRREVQFHDRSDRARLVRPLDGGGSTLGD